jgi:hypothetical protein
MRHLGLPSCVLTLLLIATGRGGVDGPGKPVGTLRFAHASLAAYPNAVISLKDPETGMTFYVESDGRRIVALDREGELAWGVDVLGEAKVKPYLGEPVVRHLRLDDGKLVATCGKKDFVRIEVKIGAVEYAGRD